MAVLNRDDMAAKYFKLFHVNNGQFIRKVKKQCSGDANDSDCFAIDHTGSIILYSYKDQLIF